MTDQSRTDSTAEFSAYAEPTRELAQLRPAPADAAPVSPVQPETRGRAAIVIGTAVLLAAMVGAAVYAASGPMQKGPDPVGEASWHGPAAAATSASASPSPSPSASPSPSPSASPTGNIAMASLLVGPHTVRVSAQGWWSWALMDLRTGKVYGSRNFHGANKTASMIKAWIAADYLRREAEAGRQPSSDRLHQVEIMVRDSDNASATQLFALVGKSASTKRMIVMCGMSDSTAFDNWSNTLVSAHDAAKLGACIASGKAAGPAWTSWLIKQMRLVRGIGNFGIRKAFPTAIQPTIAIKNGWVDRSATQEYNVNCLAIGDGWSMAVETRYPVALGYSYGANICKSVASQLKN